MLLLLSGCSGEDKQESGVWNMEEGGIETRVFLAFIEFFIIF